MNRFQVLPLRRNFALELKRDRRGEGGRLLKAHNARELIKRRQSSSESSRGAACFSSSTLADLKSIFFFFFFVSSELTAADAIAVYLAVLQIPTTEAERNPRRGIIYNYPARKPVRPRAQLGHTRRAADSILYSRHPLPFSQISGALYKRSDPRLELIFEPRQPTISGFFPVGESMSAGLRILLAADAPRECTIEE